MEDYIIEKLRKNGNGYVKIENEDSLKKIYNLFKDKIFIEPTNEIEYLYYGVYYDLFEKDYDLMKKYYLIAIDQNNSSAMHKLGYYYENVKDYSLMKKYYLMAVDQNYSRSMNNLGNYYKKVEKDYGLMEKYYLMAIDLNNINSMYNLGNYYYTIKDYDLMKKYYLMAISQNHINSMYNLGVYYKNIEKDYDLMKKYYLMAISQNNSFAMNNLGYYYENVKDYDLMKKYYLMAIDQNHSNAIDNLKKYYNENKNDQSFVELYKYEQFLDLFNERFNSDINLSQQYYYSFLQWKTNNNKIKMKQYILRKTGVFPRKYNKNLLINFVEIVSLKNTILPKDMMYLIAGHLFV